MRAACDGENAIPSRPRQRTAMLLFMPISLGCKGQNQNVTFFTDPVNCLETVHFKILGGNEAQFLLYLSMSVYI